jgi:Winged helix-turn helix
VSNTLFYGNNLEVLRDRKHFPDQSIDLIYLDLPFNSNASYNVLFKGRLARGLAQIEAFGRRQHLLDISAEAFAVNGTCHSLNYLLTNSLFIARSRGYVALEQENIRRCRRLNADARMGKGAGRQPST